MTYATRTHMILFYDPYDSFILTQKFQLQKPRLHFGFVNETFVSIQMSI